MRALVGYFVFCFVVFIFRVVGSCRTGAVCFMVRCVTSVGVVSFMTVLGWCWCVCACVCVCVCVVCVCVVCGCVGVSGRGSEGAVGGGCVVGGGRGWCGVCGCVWVGECPAAGSDLERKGRGLMDRHELGLRIASAA